MSNKLKEAREIINRVDGEMARLFIERMSAAAMIADYKKENGLEIFDPRREDELIAQNSLLVEDDEIRSYYVNFLKDTMKVSRAYQSKLMEGMRVAYCGTEGAFAHIATCRRFPTARKVAYSTFDEAYRAVVDGECDVAMLPIENSYNGEVGQVTDLMFRGPLYVNGVTELAVSHDLLALPGTSLSDIKTVISHPQALGQCADFIKEHGLLSTEFSNTALAAKFVSEQSDISVAAIASEEAGEIFGLEVIAKKINASRMNTTRFAVLSRSENRHKGGESGVHTIIFFTVRNEAGSLAKAIEVIGKHGFNMHSLRSRPLKDLLWQYYFYVEAEGNVCSDEGRAMMEELAQYCDRLRAVGTFQKS